VLRRMAELDRALLRKLAEWSPGPLSVTTIYLSVDGRLFPRRQDFEVHLEELLRSARVQAESMPREAIRSVERDAEAVREFIAGFERGNTRGLAMFSCSGIGLWEEIELSRPVRNRAVVDSHPDLIPLEAVLEVYESFCTVLVDSAKARIYLAELGRIEEQSDLLDDVPGRHDQGGWSQARYQRHVDEHRQRHLKHTGEVLLRLYKRRQFDHLILAGPQEIVAEFERDLHDYLRKRIRARINLPVTTSATEVLERSLQLEEELEHERERETVDRLKADAAAGRQAVMGLSDTLRALGDNRAATLIVAFDLHVPGHECSNCGRLSEKGGRCETCGAEPHPVRDVVESAVAQAVRQGCRVETVTGETSLQEIDGIGALLRF
jgi:peptide chain release factor subunit 1